MIQEILNILDEHKHLSLQDESNRRYLSGLIEQMFKTPVGEFMGKDIWGNEYDPKQMGDQNDFSPDPDRVEVQPIQTYERRVKSYGFFKNEYYDEEEG